MTEVEQEAPRWRQIVDFPLSALLISMFVFALVLLLFIALHGKRPSVPNIEFSAISAALKIALSFAAYKLVLRHLGAVPRDDLRFSGAASRLALGFLVGIVIISVVVGVTALIGSYRIDACCSSKQLFIILLDDGVSAAVMEELFFRGILFRWVEEFSGSWSALIVTAVLFGLAHRLNPNATWFSSFAIAVEAGLLLGGAYMLTRSLWLPMGLHAGWNFAQGYIYDVAVSGHAEQGLVTAKISGPVLLSGGNFGLEASIITVLIAGAAGSCAVWLAVRRGEVVRPWWVRRRELAS